ncbi:MAG TPA: hypothetical protein VGL93_10395 [Streptosporangiaceae bacterium]
MTGRRWTVALPPGLALPTSNHRHGHPAKLGAAMRVVKDAAILTTRSARIPTMTGPVRLVAEFRPPAGTRARVVRDTHNLAPAVKAAIDGAVKAGALRDDDDQHVTAVEFHPGPAIDRAGGQLLLHLDPPEHAQDEVDRLRGIAAGAAALIAALPGGADALDLHDADVKISAALLRALRDALTDPGDDPR